MSDMLNILIAIRTISELVAAIDRAAQANRDLTDEELKAATEAAFARADAADAKWLKQGTD